MEDPRRIAPSAERNKEPLFDALSALLPRPGHILEIAAGTGQHAAYMTNRMPEWTWWPTDADADMLASIDAYAGDSQGTVMPARRLDVTARPWDQVPDVVDAILAVNLVHITPWAVSEALIAGAGAVLKSGGRLILYGPFKINRQHTAQSNADFEASFLKQKDPAFGVRDLGDLARLGEASGFALPDRIAMPANNFCVIFTKQAG